MQEEELIDKGIQTIKDVISATEKHIQHLVDMRDELIKQNKKWWRIGFFSYKDQIDTLNKYIVNNAVELSNLKLTLSEYEMYKALIYKK